MNYTNNVIEILSFYDSSDLLVFFYFRQSIALIFVNKLYTLSKCYLATFDCLRTLSWIKTSYFWTKFCSQFQQKAILSQISTLKGGKEMKQKQI